jgi:hypothetical protein
VEHLWISCAFLAAIFAGSCLAMGMNAARQLKVGQHSLTTQTRSRLKEERLSYHVAFGVFLVFTLIFANLA